jgi:hypothetical protein
MKVSDYVKNSADICVLLLGKIQGDVFFFFFSFFFLENERRNYVFFFLLKCLLYKIIKPSSLVCIGQGVHES